MKYSCYEKRRCFTSLHNEVSINQADNSSLLVVLWSVWRYDRGPRTVNICQFGSLGVQKNTETEKLKEDISRGGGGVTVNSTDTYYIIRPPTPGPPPVYPPSKNVPSAIKSTPLSFPSTIGPPTICPLSDVRLEGYFTCLDYWRGAHTLWHVALFCLMYCLLCRERITTCCWHILTGLNHNSEQVKCILNTFTFTLFFALKFSG